MATLAALRCNPIIIAFASRLRERGKRFKVIAVACMHKLPIILNAIAKSGKPWQPCEAAA